ncbi:MAG: sugar ABC transporter permease [Paenibacillaceae bacterium]|nr:sugar ABC transporter permease [Paenibacillaceae bacterium]
MMSQYQLLVMSLPVLILVTMSYAPLWGWIMAFQKYSIAKGMTGSPFVGLDNFIKLFHDYRFYNALRNTLAMGAMSLAINFVCAIGLAILLNEVRAALFKRTIQTISYIPHFVSWVVIANIVTLVLSPDHGLLNELLLKAGLEEKPIYFLAKGNWFWVIHSLAALWKELGWNTIIYLAVLSGINAEQYEAAEVDGAGRFRKMWHISVPGLMPTATILLILYSGYIISSGYESQFLLGNGLNMDYSKVLDIYALEYSFQIGDYSYGVAISMFKSVVSMTLVLLINQLARKWSQTRLL